MIKEKQLLKTQWNGKKWKDSIYNDIILHNAIGGYDDILFEII